MLTMQEFWLSLKSVLRSARQLINTKLEPLGLTSSEGDILFQLVSESRGLTQEELTERLDVGKAAVSRTIDSLVDKGYVKREQHPEIARANRITLTEKANEISTLVSNVYNNVYETLKGNITEEELEHVSTLLVRVSQNIQSQGVRFK